MNHDAAVRYLLSLGRELAAPTQAAAAKFNLENISLLAKTLGNPERSYPTAHIAGTNGKGSTAAFLESILRHGGLRTGLYTSPHLEKINERLRVANQEISDDDFAAAFTKIQNLIETLLAQGMLRAHPTYFECVTAMAFQYFKDTRVAVGIFEVGLGGRLDATNILLPTVSIITPVDFDHENFLGHSIAEIAREKAGILKPQVPLVLAPQHAEARQVILQRAAELDVPVIETAKALHVESETLEAGCVRASVRDAATGDRFDLTPQLPGRFQLQNALNAIAAAQLLQKSGVPLEAEAIPRGVAAATWPGRLEKLQSHPDIYLDGAHNPAAARELANFLRENFAGRKIWMLYGALRDKAVDEVAGAILPLATEVIFTEAATPRAISAVQLADMAGYLAQKFVIKPDAGDAVEYALQRAGTQDAIFVTGSLYLVGQLRGSLKLRSQVAHQPKTP